MENRIQGKPKESLWLPSRRSSPTRHSRSPAGHPCPGPGPAQHPGARLRGRPGTGEGGGEAAWREAIRRILSCHDSGTHRQKLFFCWLWDMLLEELPMVSASSDEPFLFHMSYGGLQIPLAGEAPILQTHSSQFIPNLACADDHLLL